MLSSVRKTKIVASHLHVPSKEHVEERVLEFYLRMKRKVDPEITADTLTYDVKKTIRAVAKRIHDRREGAAGLQSLKEWHRAQIGALAQHGASIAGPCSENQVDEWAAEVHARTPWLGEITAFLMKRMRRQVRQGRPGLLMPPLLLVGEPGNGKSWYAEMIGRMAGAPVREIDLGAGGASFRISGLEKGWGSAGPGIPVEMMLQHKIANPVIVVNEICKAGRRIRSDSGGVVSLTTALLQMLERETAGRFECPSFRVSFDLSRVNWVLTANDLETIPAPLVDRCHVFPIPAVTPDVASVMFETIVQSQENDMDPELLDFARREVVAAARRGHVSLRQIQRVIESTFNASDELFH